MSTPQRPDLSPGPGPASARPGRKTSWMSSHKILTTIGIMLIIGTIANLSEAEAPPATPRSTDGTVTADQPSGSAPNDEPATIAIPDLSHLEANEARMELRALGLRIDVDKEYSKKRPGTVLGVSPGEGSELGAGSKVTLVVALAYPKVPLVMSDGAGAASSALRKAGFKVSVKREVSDAPAGTVIEVRPAAGSPLLPGRTVTLVVAKEAPASPIGSNCHPSYQGQCLDPNASDYDCAGGSGDGPLYTGLVRVVGYDEYGLDSDNDGSGCES
ncbi:MAG: PASTA domain-containing protein [Actinomycetota bacterium]